MALKVGFTAETLGWGFRSRDAQSPTKQECMDVCITKWDFSDNSAPVFILQI